jgi:mannose-6-phosphate isomerase-like protein (cupin superfamily)
MSFLDVARKGLGRCVVDGDLAADALKLHVSQLEPGTSAHAAHTHDAAEAFYVLEGQALVEVDGARHELSANEAMILDAHKLHGISNSGKTVLRYLVIIASR